MSGDTVVLFWSGGKLYMCPVYTLWDSFETAPVTGSLHSVAANRHPLDTVHIGPGVDFRVNLDIPWNELNTVSLPDVLGLHAWRPGAALIRVLTGRDRRSVRALVPDDNVVDRGYHDCSRHGPC